MRKSVLLVVLLATPLFAQRGNPDVAFGGKSVDPMIAAFMKEHDVPGMSLAIVQAPYITRATGYGLADRERRTLVSANTMFDVAQMRNAFTAVAVMQLVEGGTLGLDDVRELLRTPAGFAQLETMVATASGQTWEQFVRKGQLDPLGLKHTFFASELDRVPAARIDPTEPATGSVTGRGPVAIYASAGDISFWDIALAGDALIHDPELRKILYSPPSNGAWFFPGHQGLMIATGSGHGFSSLLSRFTKSDELVCVTLLANKEGLDLTQLARQIAGAFNPKLGPPASTAGLRVQQSPWSLAETKERAARSGAAVNVFEENGEVWVTSTDPNSDEALLRIVK